MKVYKFNEIYDQKKLLATNLTQKNLIYTLNLGEQQIIINSHLIQCGMCICTLENKLHVINLIGEDKYAKTKEVLVHKQYTNTTVTALCYARSSAKIFIGTSMGELMIFDIDISKITMTIREPFGKIVAVKFFEGLKNIYLFL